MACCGVRSEVDASHLVRRREIAVHIPVDPCVNRAINNRVENIPHREPADVEAILLTERIEGGGGIAQDDDGALIVLVAAVVDLIEEPLDRLAIGRGDLMRANGTGCLLTDWLAHNAVELLWASAAVPAAGAPEGCTEEDDFLVALAPGPGGVVHHCQAVLVNRCHRGRYIEHGLGRLCCPLLDAWHPEDTVPVGRCPANEFGSLFTEWTANVTTEGENGGCGLDQLRPVSHRAAMANAEFTCVLKTEHCRVRVD